VTRPLKSALRVVGLRSGACEVALLLLGVRCSPAYRSIRFERPLFGDRLNVALGGMGLRYRMNDSFTDFLPPLPINVRTCA
jgi:hypothetical protein